MREQDKDLNMFLKPEYGTSGMHFGKQSTPISFCGWVDCGPRYEFEGVGFSIDEQWLHSQEGEVELYYVDDDMLGIGDLPDHRSDRPMAYFQKMAADIAACSSGIIDVRLHRVFEENRIFRGQRRGSGSVTSFRFRVDDGAIKEYMTVSQRPIHTDDLGKYVFVLPKAGEFYCELGLIKAGERVPLLIDDYCMK